MDREMEETYKKYNRGSESLDFDENLVDGY